MKINKVSPLEHSYLQMIGTIAKPPKSLYMLGSLQTERRVTVAIVGTRKPSSYGKEVTGQLAYELAKRGASLPAASHSVSTASLTRQRLRLGARRLPYSPTVCRPFIPPLIRASLNGLPRVMVLLSVSMSPARLLWGSGF